MFKRFRKHVGTVIRDNFSVTEEMYPFLGRFGGYKCITSKVAEIPYNEAWKMAASCKYHDVVFQDGKQKNFFEMNPFKEAIIIFFEKYSFNKARVFNYLPKATMATLKCKDLEQMSGNFSLYNAYLLEDGKEVVVNFEDLESMQYNEVIFISKEKIEVGTSNANIVVRYYPKKLEEMSFEEI